MRKLKTSEIPVVRESMRANQGGCCAVCRLPVSKEQAVLDHDHGTGIVRAVLHRGCNSLLGKVENNYRRYGVRSLDAFLAGTANYLGLHITDRTGLIHPTHKSEEEKRVARNAKARKARATKKAT